MRVAVVASSDVSGGAEQYLYRLYRRLRSDFDVHATLVGRLPEWTAELGPTVPVRSSVKLTRRRGLVRQGLETALLAPKLVAAVRDVRPDVVHVQYFREKMILPRAVGGQIPVVWTEHGPLPDNMPPGLLPYLRWQSGASSVIAIGSGVGRSLRDAGIGSDMIRNPIPEDFLTSRTGAHPVARPLPDSYVLYVGRLHDAKRVDLILDVAANDPARAFVIAGTGAAHARLQARATPNVVFLGHVDVTSELYRGARAVVVSSGRAAREGLPMTLLEARAVGTPVLVAEDCHAVDDAIALGARTFEPCANALGEALHAVDGNRTAGAAGVQLAQEFSETEWARRHHESLVAAARSRGRGR